MARSRGCGHRHRAAAIGFVRLALVALQGMGIRSFSAKGKGGGRKLPKAAIVLLVLGAGALLAVVVMSVSRHDDLVKWRARLEADAGRPPWPAWQDNWPPLPKPSRLHSRSVADVKGAYAFAATHREILSDIPCYCGCVREGHESVLQCYLSGARADGTPIWTDHSFDCTLCIHIAREVMLMSTQGRSPTDIRATIESKYRNVGAPTRTAAPSMHSHP